MKTVKRVLSARENYIEKPKDTFCSLYIFMSEWDLCIDRQIVMTYIMLVTFLTENVKKTALKLTGKLFS